ncbi:disintegrin and metalloproteinase domain-containing protein 28 [Thalassophryne amazonica]|uniref:disintegrin and metalloproteinase domain-containing protein 28 n=1 Tax=Thalassophryne amazonica TaxID=390379 RepID=UPI001470F67A|nr:disintegrin and metalloproteinase domain-containing protein 28 [Thalassophryne amazonica]
MTPTLLLCILVLQTSLQPSVSHGDGFDGSKDYEVVRPIRIHTVRRKRHAEEDPRPETLKYAMTVGGKDIEMHLEKNNVLLTKDYTETHYLADDAPVTTTPTDIDHCYYHGKIVNDVGSAASISTCDGLRGYFRTSAQRYLIEPLSADDEGDHAVMKYSGDGEHSTPAVCGVTNMTWSSDFEPPVSRSRSMGMSIIQQQKYIQLYLVADNREYEKMERDQAKLRKRVFEIVNYVNLVYKPLRTFIALVGLDIWSNGDLITVTPPAGANLEAFKNWRNSDLVNRKNHDNAHLISGIDFEGPTVGLAFVGTICSDHSVGVVQDHTDTAISVGATLAHEMGHNLGMNHDDSSACVCSEESCIMAPALSWITPRSFSSCSTNTYEQYLTSRTPGCILDKPVYKEVMAPPVCGNGFVEKEEQCDCGTTQECTNPCCNATTCRLKEGSECAEGVCCENCKILSRSRECRWKHDECDIAEYCDGTSVNCPEDVFAVNGLPCNGGRGYCYNGQCPQRADQCNKMYGPAATEGRLYCYNQNKRGVYYGFCKHLSGGQYVPCQSEDVLCGKLFCHGGNANPNYGRMVTVGDCKAAFFDDWTKDYSQVDEGTKCDEGKVCSQNQCVYLQIAYTKATNCSAKCPGHAVCNHRSECQCEPGWIPPSCDSKDAVFSKLPPGATAAIVVSVILVVLGAIVVIIWFVCRKRQKPVLPTSHPQRKPQAPDMPTHQLNSQPVPSQPAPLPPTGKPKPKGVPPPPPPAGNRPNPPSNNYIEARRALKPVAPSIA